MTASSLCVVWPEVLAVRLWIHVEQLIRAREAAIGESVEKRGTIYKICACLAADVFFKATNVVAV